MTATMQPKSEAAEAPRRGRRTPGAGQAARPRGRGLEFGHWWWALPGIALVFAIHYVATGIGGFFAFTNWTGIGAFKITGWANFEAIFKDPTKLGALSNTLFLAFGSVLLGNIAGLVIALGLNRVIKTRYVLRTLFFMPVVLSPLATAYIWKYIFDFDGPLNAFLTAIGAGDLALWDIQGTALDVPVYQLLGGAVREKVLTYTHAAGWDVPELLDSVDRRRAQGFRAVRVQSGVPGLDKVYGVTRGAATYEPAGRGAGPVEEDWDTAAYRRHAPSVLAAVR